MSAIFNWFILCVCMLLFSCGPSGPIIEEANDPAFDRGRSYFKVGSDTEGMDEFLSVTRRVTRTSKSHLEAGRLLLTVASRKDPVSAIYHFRRFLLLEPNARESRMVEQLIVSAEREIIRKLPGEPYGNYLESLDLKEENDRLRREIADLQARLGAPISGFNSISEEPSDSLPVSVKPVEVEVKKKPQIPKFYVVQKGDSLYAISLKVYGNASHIDAIFSANQDTLKSKNSLKVGQKLRLPAPL